MRQSTQRPPALNTGTGQGAEGIIFFVVTPAVLWYDAVRRWRYDGDDL